MTPLRTSRAVWVVVLALLLSACGSDGSTAKPAAGPSTSAKMVCQAEAKNDIAAATGVDTVAPLHPRWSNHVYACDYVYARARQMTVSVKDASGSKDARTYLDALAKRFGRVRELANLGKIGFATTNGSVVVQKDNRILLVNIARLPARFGRPLNARSEFALLVATTIMGCWNGS